MCSAPLILLTILAVITTNKPKSIAAQCSMQHKHFTHQSWSPYANVDRVKDNIDLHLAGVNLLLSTNGCLKAHTSREWLLEQLYLLQQSGEKKIWFTSDKYVTFHCDRLLNIVLLFRSDFDTCSAILVPSKQILSCEREITSANWHRIQPNLLNSINWCTPQHNKHTHGCKQTYMHGFYQDADSALCKKT